MGERSELLPALMRRAVTEVLAEAAFMCAEPAEILLADEELLESSVRFDGPRSGRLRLTTTCVFARELAASMMGIDASHGQLDAKSADAHGEALNMIGGVLLHAWFGAAARFEIYIPEVRRIAETSAAAALPESSEGITLLVDEQHPLRLSVVLRHEGTSGEDETVGTY